MTADSAQAPSAEKPPTPQTRKNLVVTIGRQYGSGGREVGEQLARLLGVAYYDMSSSTRRPRAAGFRWSRS